MSDTFLSELTTAQDIIYEAYSHYDKADDLEEEYLKQKKKAKYKMIGIAVVGFLAMMFFMNVHPIIKVLKNMIIIAATAYGIFYVYHDAAEKATDYAERINNERKMGDTVLDSNEDKLSFLQRDYWYPIAIDYIVKIVQAGRANDLNQALSMYDEQYHRWKMEEANSKIYEELTRQSKKLSDIEVENAVNTTVNIMDFISRQ